MHRSPTPCRARRVHRAGREERWGSDADRAQEDSVNSLEATDAVKPVAFRAEVKGGTLKISLPAKSVAVMELVR